MFDAYDDVDVSADSNDTHIYPYVQYGHAGVDAELAFMRRLLAFKVCVELVNVSLTVFFQESALEITMASGYFNTLVEYMERIANAGTYRFAVYAASAEVGALVLVGLCC